jgi:integrase/recombinase XerD
MNLVTALDGYWLVKERQMSQHTVRDYQLTFRRLVEFLPQDIAFCDITPEHLHQFLNLCKRRHKLSDKSLCNVWIALSSLWTWAEVQIGAPHVVRGRVPRPRFRRPPIEGYTEAEVKAMLYACDSAAKWTSTRRQVAQASRPSSLRDRALLITLLDTGLRASELCALTVRDYDAKTGRVGVKQGKGKKDRVVYLGMTARKTVWRYMATRPNARVGEPLFATREGTHLDRNNLRHLIDRIAERAGVEHATVHRFRHTFAINFLRNGGNLLELQRLMGHERMDTLHIYVQLAQSDLSAAQRVASPADNWKL